MSSVNKHHARLSISIPLLFHFPGQRDLSNCMLRSFHSQISVLTNPDQNEKVKYISCCLVNQHTCVTKLRSKIINSAFETHLIVLLTSFEHCFSGSEFGLGLNVHFFSYEALTRRINRLIKYAGRQTIQAGATLTYVT